MDIHKVLRKIASKSYYQNIYNNDKNIGIKLFENSTDLNSIQSLFVRYLNFYASLYMDIQLGDVPELVLENHIYEDAYFLYKNKIEKNKYKQTLTPQQRHGTKNNETPVKTSKWIFKKQSK